MLIDEKVCTEIVCIFSSLYALLNYCGKKKKTKKGTEEAATTPKTEICGTCQSLTANGAAGAPAYVVYILGHDDDYAAFVQRERESEKDLARTANIEQQHIANRAAAQQQQHTTRS